MRWTRDISVSPPLYNLDGLTAMEIRMLRTLLAAEVSYHARKGKASREATRQGKALPKDLGAEHHSKMEARAFGLLHNLPEHV